MRKMISNFFQDESGQTSTEYILLVAVVALLVIKFKNVAGDKLTKLTEGVFQSGDQILNQINNEIN